MERWIETTAQFDWPVPGKRAMLSFAAGNVHRMTNTQADACIAAGKGFDASRPADVKVEKNGKVVKAK